jgi:uncharacterized protein (TIGR02147 family)
VLNIAVEAEQAKVTTMSSERPTIASYERPEEYMAAMIDYRKSAEEGFSVLTATKGLRRVSPTLVTLIRQGKRTLTLDRADDFARLLGLSIDEKIYWREWLGRCHRQGQNTDDWSTQNLKQQNRTQVSVHLLSDWLNVYVKDSFHLPAVRENANHIYARLAGVASESRIRRSLDFLLKHGYLRRTVTGAIVVESPLHTVDVKVPTSKVRDFHRNAMKIAMRALQIFSPSQRYANTVVLALDKEKYEELTLLIAEFSEKVKNLAEKPSAKEGLYQLVVNLSPTGKVDHE